MLRSWDVFSLQVQNQWHHHYSITIYGKAHLSNSWVKELINGQSNGEYFMKSLFLKTGNKFLFLSQIRKEKFFPDQLTFESSYKTIFIF